MSFVGIQHQEEVLSLSSKQITLVLQPSTKTWEKKWLRCREEERGEEGEKGGERAW